ncbi:MAG: GNAT family N-acetyltransferase [Anaerolineae bacterium]
MLIRTLRDGDLEACSDIDLSYETGTAWQMDEYQEGGEWHICFREIRLPRKLHIHHTASESELTKSWQKRDKFWVAVEHREIIGYLGIDIDPARREAEIADLAVAPEYRRKGVATQLLRRATEWCFRQHMDQLILVCPLRAYPAISFALKHRFAFSGYQDAYWPGQEVALFFRQRIR